MECKADLHELVAQRKLLIDDPGMYGHKIPITKIEEVYDYGETKYYLSFNDKATRAGRSDGVRGIGDGWRETNEIGRH